MFESNYQELAQAIILDAVKAYRKNYPKALKYRARGKRMISVEKEVSSCERFFLSNWFEELSGIDGQMILKKLQEEMENESKRISDAS